MKSNIKSITEPYGMCSSIAEGDVYIILPDVHGCLIELKELIKDVKDSLSSKLNLNFLFLGDLVDRGPFSYETLEYVWSSENMFAIMGNHEKKILRKLEGAEVTQNEDQRWYNQITNKQKQNILSWYQDIPVFYNLKTKNKEFFFAHAGIKSSLYSSNRNNFFLPLTSSERDIALYGHTTGEKDPVTNFPIRLHEPCPESNIVNVFGHITHNCISTDQWIKINEPGTTIQLDHGAVHGGHLTAMILNSFGDYFFLSHKVNSIYMPSKTTDFSKPTEQRRIIYNET